MHWPALMLILFSFESLIQPGTSYILEQSGSLYSRSPIPGTAPSRPISPPKRRPKLKAHQSGRQLTRAEGLPFDSPGGARMRRVGERLTTLSPIMTPLTPSTPTQSRQRLVVLPEQDRSESSSSPPGTPRRGNSLPPLPSFPSSLGTPTTSAGTPPLRYSPPRGLRPQSAQAIGRSSSQMSQISSIGSESTVGRATRNLPTPFGSPRAQAMGAIPKGLENQPGHMSASSSATSGCLNCCFGGIC